MGTQTRDKKEGGEGQGLRVDMCLTSACAPKHMGPDPSVSALAHYRGRPQRPLQAGEGEGSVFSVYILWTDHALKNNDKNDFTPTLNP